jgi:serine/threonine protein kinase
VTPASSPKLLDGKYEIVRLLGKGGMGAVYEARHRATGRRVAVKVIALDRLPSSSAIVQRFRREALVSGAIESQYVAQIFDAGVDPLSGQPYMALELLVGEDLNRAIGRMGSVPVDLALRVAAQACLGLQKAHEAGVTHRDIKPANLFLARREGEVVVKVLDFGLAKAKDDLHGLGEGREAGALSTSGAIVGSPNYMSPEQALGQKSLDHRTDVWSLGVVLYEMFSGKTPTDGAATAGEVILRICTHPPRPLRELAPGLTPEVAAVVHRALAREPGDRFPTAAAMYGAIRALLPNGHALEESMFPPLPARVPSDAAPAPAVSSAIHDDSTLTPEEDAGLRAARDGALAEAPRRMDAPGASGAEVRATTLTHAPPAASKQGWLGLGVASLALVGLLGGGALLYARRAPAPSVPAASAPSILSVTSAGARVPEPANPLPSPSAAPAPPTSASVVLPAFPSAPPRALPRPRASASSAPPPRPSAAPAPSSSPSAKGDPSAPFGSGGRK